MTNQNHSEPFNQIRMTEYSHGAGCGCKISPQVLKKLLATSKNSYQDPRLIVDNLNNDDAAVVDIGNNMAIISTTDFFMPIVDDPYCFGQIAATNAISDIYAMGGKPIVAISIFAWPLVKISPDIGALVIDGGRDICKQAGISLAGGHSIDAPEPIFGLAVTGKIAKDMIKTNSGAKANDKIYLTKPLGVGILSTAQKQNKLQAQHINIATDSMLKLNDIGMEFAKIKGVNAMTDVTGFGLGGHLLEMCKASDVSARLDFSAIKLLPHTLDYLNKGCVPGGSGRNYSSLKDRFGSMTPTQKNIIFDPQTSGGLLVSVSPDAELEFNQLCKSKLGTSLQPIGQFYDKNQEVIISLR